MPVTVTKNPGQGDAPFFSSGSISFSSLRSAFMEIDSGSVSASVLRRNTNTQLANPIVPDSTENAQISTENNLSLSQFRNSIKRYLAVQTGTDDNADFPGEPGFRMGLFASNGRGIDWSGGGSSGVDGQDGGGTGNHSRNVQKTIRINGTCGSVRLTDSSGLITAAAQLTGESISQVNNVRIEVFGSLLGYGGDGGFDPTGFPNGNESGEDGGHALNLGNTGSNNVVFVDPNARIWGGGGGGEQGGNGERPLPGTCRREYAVQQCGGTPNCNQGGTRVRNFGGNCCQSTCDGWPGCRERCVNWLNGIICRIEQISTTPVQGIGGRGGNGQGYNKPRTDGENGTGAATDCPTCPNGFGLIGGVCTSAGQIGGNGGDWGTAGDAAVDNGGPESVPGAAGRAITFNGDDYALIGTINTNTVRGTTREGR